MALLEVENLSLAFSGLRALTNVSFNVDAGQIVGLIGPNGAGKSTLLNCISRLYRPDSGAIRFEGADLGNRKPHEVAALGIRRTFQNLELFREASVRENVTLGLAYRYRAPLVSEFFDLPLSRAQRRAAAEEADRILAACGLIWSPTPSYRNSLMEYRRPSSLRARSPAIQSFFYSMNPPPA